MRLREDQRRFIDDLRSSLAEHRWIIGRAPTGFGKTVVMGAIAQNVSSNVKKDGSQYRCGIICHRVEILNQTCKTLDQWGLAHDYGVVAAGRVAKPYLPFQVMMITTLARRDLEFIRRFDLMLIDECHHIRASTWEKVMAECRSTRCVGFTATPRRLDGKGLGRWFKKIVSAPEIKDLTQAGHLAPVKHIAPAAGVFRASDAGVRTRFGDYDKKQLAELMADRAAAIEAIAEHAKGRKFLYFGVNIADSTRVTAGLSKKGFRVAHLDAKTDKRTRENAIQGLRDGKLDGICNVALFEEGVDCPACDCVVLGTPTKSLTRYLQMIGRCMRPQEGKEALVVDLCDLWDEGAGGHGLVEKVHEWTLDDKSEKKRKSAASNPLTPCPKCGTIISLRLEKCDACGFDLEEWRKKNARKLKEEEMRFRDVSDAKSEAVGAVKAANLTKRALRFCKKHDDFGKLEQYLRGEKTKDGRRPSPGYARRIWDIHSRMRSR